MAIPAGFELVPKEDEQQPSSIPAGFEIVESRGGSVVEDPQLGSALDVTRSISSALVSTAAGGLAGLGVGFGELFGLADPGAGARTVEAFQLQIQPPETEEGRQVIKILGKGVQNIVDALNVPSSGIAGVVELISLQGLEQATETVRSIQENGLGETLGSRVLEETDSPLLATLIKIFPEAVFEIAALKGAGGIGSDIFEGVRKFQTPGKREIARLLEENPNDLRTAEFQISERRRLNEPEIKRLPAPDSPDANLPVKLEPDLPIQTKLQSFLDVGGPKISKDKFAVAAIRQGFDPGVIAPVKGSNRATQDKLLDMVDLQEKVKFDKVFAIDNRPTDIVGDSLMDRFRIVQSVNRKSGKALAVEANKLRGKRVEFDEAIKTFINDLGEIGVRIVPDKNGILVPNFRGSAISGLAAPEALIKRVVKRLGEGGRVSAFDLHRTKQFLDELITFGKGAEGLGGRAETIVKNLRFNIKETLNTNFPDYARVNKTYSQTIDAIDSIQEALPKRIDFQAKGADKAVGTGLRGLMSNRSTRVELLNAVRNIDAIAQRFTPKSKAGAVVKFGTPRRTIDDDIMTQVLFADELDRVFGSVARTGFKGQITQAIKEGLTTSTAGVIRRTISKVSDITVDLVKGKINEEQALKSIRDLLQASKVK